jgi:two-component system, chemotaxis family, CheB/CheR fusion protein
VDSDMKNLLNSTDIATLFLDKELNIRRYTNQATKIFKLIKSDIGRRFTDLVSDLDYSELVNDAQEVLRSLIFIQKQIPGKDGKWFSVRIMPYRTVDDRIDGLVITFFNLSDLKQIESKLHETTQMNQILLNSSASAVIRLSPDGKIEEFNSSSEKLFGRKRKDVINQDFTKTFVSRATRKETEKKLKALIENRIENKIANKAENRIKMHIIAAGDKIEESEWSAVILSNHLNVPVGLLIINNHVP